MRSFVALLVPVVCFCGIFQPAALAEMRTWTDLSGRQIEAALVDVEEDRITIVREDGRPFTVESATFSESDRAYVREWLRQKAHAEELGPAEWPDRVQERAPRVEIVEEQGETNIYRTEHFEFRSDTRLSRTLVARFGQIFEATFAAVQALPLGLDITAPEAGHFVTRLFADPEDYYSAGGVAGSGGLYSTARREILVPIENLGVRRSSSGFSFDRYRDNSTLIHEITHQVMHRWFNYLPVWLTEGIAAYMETIPYRRGAFQFRQQNLREYLNQKVGEDPVPIAPIESLMDLSYREWTERFASNRSGVPRNYYTAALLTHYYFHLDGDGDSARLIHYIRALRAGVGEEEARHVLLDGRTPRELEDDLVVAFRRIRVRLASP